MWTRLLKDFTWMVWSTFKHRKLRSWLTMVGIFIGIAAVVSLVSLGQGLQQSIELQFEELGTDTIFIQPKTALGIAFGSVTNPLTKDDVRIIEGVRGVSQITDFYFNTAKVEFDDQLKYFFIMGFSEDKEEREFVMDALDLEIIEGRNLKKGDNRKVLLGYRHAYKNIWGGKNIEIRDRILINDIEFQVVGILSPVGNPEDDQNIMIMENAIRELYNVPDEISAIFAKTGKGFDSAKVGDDIEDELRRFRDVKEGKEDFTVQTPEEFLNALNNVLAIVNFVLIGLAAISLIVGGIGITNTMYTSVLERTKEIGIMKAIGAKNSHIAAIFLIESGLLGLAGGAIGIIMGIIISEGVAYFIRESYGLVIFQAFFPWYLILGALSFSFVIGAIAGFLPARQASKLRPVDSLRYS